MEVKIMTVRQWMIKCSSNQHRNGMKKKVKEKEKIEAKELKAQKLLKDTEELKEETSKKRLKQTTKSSRLSNVNWEDMKA